LGFNRFKLSQHNYIKTFRTIDFLLEKDNEKCLLEVKGCTLVKNQTALFPDAPTERGRRQIDILTKMKEKGYDAAVLFLVLREDVQNFSPNWNIDPQFSEKLKLAQKTGVKVLACQVTFKLPVII